MIPENSKNDIEDFFRARDPFWGPERSQNGPKYDFLYKIQKKIVKAGNDMMNTVEIISELFLTSRPLF